MKKHLLSIVFFIVLNFFQVQCVKHLPSYITVCNRNDPELNTCMLNAIEQVKPHLKDGIPELLIPSTNPIVVPKAELETQGSFKIKFENMKMYYIDTFEVKRINVDPNKQLLEMDLYFPFLKVDADYEVSGRILVFQLEGNGRCLGNCSDLNAKMVIHGESMFKRGKEYIKFEKSSIDLKLGKVFVYFHDLFKNNKELTQHVNQVVNENIDVLLEELKPVLEECVLAVGFGFVSKIFNRFSIDELFPLK